MDHAAVQGLSNASPIDQTPDGSFWLGTGNGVVRIDAKSPPTVITGGEQTQALIADPEGRIWFALVLD